MNLNLQKVKLLALILFIYGSMSIYAQDIHFSQYYASPLTLNPALTGKFNGQYRISGIYRSQWAPAGSPLFMTPALAVDGSLFKGLLKKDAVGVGLVLFTDRQNKATLVQYQILGSLAYHKGLGANNGTQISLGFQGGYVLKQLNSAKLQFGDGFALGGPGGGYAYTSSAEIASLKNKFGYFNMNAGLFVNSRIAKSAVLYGGYSFNNLGRPVEQFSSATIDKVGVAWRHVVHIGAEVDATQRIVLIPGILWQMQAKAQELNFGITAGYHVKLDPNGGTDHTTVFLGLWNRMTPNYISNAKAKYGEESIIPKIGLEINRIRFGAALDIPLSKISLTKNGIVSGTGLAASYKGNRPLAFEISLAYVGRTFTPKENIYLFNPRF
ncbi:MAG: PorP/SprF family type IX secretion system membrane protein [Bacteroidota bacterium]